MADESWSWRSSIPGTRAYRRAVQQFIVNRMHEARLLEIGLPKQSGPVLHAHGKRLAVIDRWTYALLAPFRIIRIVVTFAFWLFGPLVLLLIADASFRTLGERSLAWAGATLAGGAASIVLVIPFIWAKEARQALVSPLAFRLLAMLLSALFVAAGLSILLASGPLDYTEFIAAAGFVTPVALLLAVLVFNTIQKGIVRWIDHRKAFLEPESVIVLHLLDAKVRAGESDWRTNPNDRKGLLATLDYVSTTFRRALPNARRSGDAVVDAWTAQHYAAAGEAIRSLKKLVLVPRVNSTEQLREKTLAAATAILDGAWDTLPRQDPPRVTAGIFGGIGRLTRALLVAALPVIFLYAGARYGLELPQEMRRFAEIGAWVWPLSA